MKIPLNNKEAAEFVEKSSDDTIAKLVSVYEEIKKYEDNLEFVVKNTNTEAHEKARSEYYNKLSQLDEEFVNNAEEIQKKADDQMNAGEAETEKKIKKEYDVLLNDIDEIEKQHDSLNQFVNQKLSAP